MCIRMLPVHHLFLSIVLLKYKYNCIQNRHACKDPGTPGNGTRRVLSFLEGHMATFGCQNGYRLEGSRSRTCYASNPNNTYWSGEPVICIGI